MVQIKFGPLYTRVHYLVGPREFAGMTEEWGFDSLWVPETPVTPEPGLDCFTTLGAFVEHTDRLTLGTCVILVPLRHPAILAKEVATLDYLSGGRIVLGVGVGGASSAALQVSGVDPRERGARTDEALEIVTQLWTGDTVSHHGRYYHFDDMCMEPAPVQRPRPPIWVGGESEGAMRRTARWGDGYVPARITPAGYHRAIQRIERHAQEIGRDASSITRALHLYFRIGEDREQAERDANEDILKRVGRGLTGERGCAAGTPDDCARTIQRFISAGVEHFVVNPACGPPEYVSQLERFARDVLPRFR
ncbi:MAG: LLM class flavin-dependent oxidoreductase [Chloroflexi bacterium]|nr:LLM class flavin-dependent oxidoreductase [Chloroflexota bacterium]